MFGKSKSLRIDALFSGKGPYFVFFVSACHGLHLGCRRAALAMAAGISTGRSPFLRVDTPRAGKAEDSIQQQKNRIILDARAKLVEQSGNSDHAMLAAMFMAWESLPTGGRDGMKYCEKLGLSVTGMRDMLQLCSSIRLGTFLGRLRTIR